MNPVAAALERVVVVPFAVDHSVWLLKLLQLWQIYVAVHLRDRLQEISADTINRDWSCKSMYIYGKDCCD